MILTMKSVTLLFTILLCIKTSNTYKSPCIKEHCNGPFTLKKYSATIEENYTQMKGKLKTVSGTAMLTTIEKEAAKYYFYNGGSIDPNSRVETERKIFNVTEDEFKLKKCRIGDEYNPGEKWGSDARVCDEWLRETKYVSDSEGRRYRYYPTYGDAPFASHMCVTSWRCKIHTTTVPIHIIGRENGFETIRVGTFGPKGQVIEVAKLIGKISAPIEMNAKYSEGEFHSEIKYMATVSESEENVTCFTHTTEKTLCKSNNIIYTMECNNGTCIGAHKTILLMVKKSTTTKSDIELSIDAAASIEDLKSTQTQAMFFSMNVNYNVEILQYDLLNLYNVIDKMITSLGKLDDELIPSILGKVGKTIWQTHNDFLVCPCFEVNIPEGHNCANGHIYDNGRVKRISNEEEKERCVKFNSKTKPVDVFKAKEIVINQLEFEPSNGTSAEWEGWTWISEEKERNMKSMDFVSTLSNSNYTYSSIFTDSSSIFGFWSKLTYIFTTSFVTWLNSVLILILCITRK